MRAAYADDMAPRFGLGADAHIAEVSQSLANIRDWGGRFVTAIPNLEIF